MKDKNKPIYVSKCCNSEMTVVGDSFGEGTNHYECNECHQPCDILEKKTKELDWVEIIKNHFIRGTSLGSIAFNSNETALSIKAQAEKEYEYLIEEHLNFIQSLLTQQRTELLEEINKICKETPEIIDKWKCSEKDSWYIKNVIDSFKSQITNLLNKKDE